VFSARPLRWWACWRQASREVAKSERNFEPYVQYESHAPHRTKLPADPLVRDQVCERLLLGSCLDASCIVVTVAKGRVALTGTVPSERMREAATAAASSVAAGAVDSRLDVAATAVGARASLRSGQALAPGPAESDGDNRRPSGSEEDKDEEVGEGSHDRQWSRVADCAARHCRG
jgi:hypothetical protein